MTPEELVAASRLLASHGDRHLGSNRYIAAALLLRQALEDALETFWLDRAPGLERCSSRAQLVSLPFFTSTSATAAGVSYAWYRLSSICHHHAYELPPSHNEIDALGNIVDDFVAQMGSASAVAR